MRHAVGPSHMSPSVPRSLKRTGFDGGYPTWCVPTRVERLTEVVESTELESVYVQQPTDI